MRPRTPVDRPALATDGWVEIPQPVEAMDQCHVAFTAGTSRPGGGDWQAAFKRRRGQARVLAIPPPQHRGVVTVWTRVNGVERRVGTLTL